MDCFRWRDYKEIQFYLIFYCCDQTTWPRQLIVERVIWAYNSREKIVWHDKEAWLQSESKAVGTAGWKLTSWTTSLEQQSVSCKWCASLNFKTPHDLSQSQHCLKVQSLFWALRQSLHCSSPIQKKQITNFQHI